MYIEDDDSDDNLECNISFEELERCDINVSYAHPETFAKRRFSRLMREEKYQRQVCAVVIYEVHMVSEYGEEFRPSFKKLGELTCISEGALHLALTATATQSRHKHLQRCLILNMLLW